MEIMKKITLLASALILALPLAGQAQEISYDYIEGGYSRVDSIVDADGWALNGSVALTDEFHAFGGYTQNEFDNSNVDLDIFNIGIGYNHAFSSKLHGLARVGYENFDSNFGGSLDAWFTEVGARGVLGSHVEGWALAGYEDADNISSEFYGKLGLLVKFTPRLGVSAEVKLIDGDEQYFVGPRVTF
jgi:Ax21 family sulfation-dependent quorum factor